MERLSKLYVNEKGLLMCGDPDKKASEVRGLGQEYLNIDDPDKFDYKIRFMGPLGVKCHGYWYSCSPQFSMTD